MMWETLKIIWVLGVLWMLIALDFETVFKTVEKSFQPTWPGCEKSAEKEALVCAICYIFALSIFWPIFLLARLREWEE